MDEWQERFGGKHFITDLGDGQTVEVDGADTELGQFAVWAPTGKGHQIVEVGADLDQLRKKYQVPVEQVCLLVRN